MGKAFEFAFGSLLKPLVECGEVVTVEERSKLSRQIGRPGEFRSLHEEMVGELARFGIDLV